MKFDSYRHHRRSIRMQGYDYASAGAYFVTICAKGRACLFGEVTDGEICLNDAGEVVQTTWDGMPCHYPGVEIDAFVVMPNHVHGIIVLTDRDTVTDRDMDVGAGFKPAPTDGHRRHGLPEIVRGLKTFSSRRINELRRSSGIPVWQRSYYEHIIRNDDSLQRIRQYIIDNPTQWAFDRENPACVDDIGAQRHEEVG